MADEPKWARERGINLARGPHRVRISCPFCSTKVVVSPETKPGEIFRVTGFTCPVCNNTVTVEDIHKSLAQNALSRAHYHMRIKYKSGGKTSYYYEVNKSKEIVEFVIYQIETLVPAIRFDGHRIYPKRISEYKIFVSESPFDKSSEDLHIQYLNGYDGDFNGEDITLRGRSLSDSVSNISGVVRENYEKMVKDLELGPITPETQSNIDELSAKVKNIEDIAERTEEQTLRQTLIERIQDNLLDYIITAIIGGIAVVLWAWFGG